ncbi:hypothetical protein KAU51_01780 [Candidatus Parcubacteria bacterium]|nr:hypothetical protein [Candidatus Parcubacteria bacterium]
MYEEEKVWEEIKYCIEIGRRNDIQRCLENKLQTRRRRAIEMKKALDKEYLEIEQIEEVLEKLQEGVVVKNTEQEAERRIVGAIQV